MLNGLAGFKSQHDQNSCLLPFQCCFLLIVSCGFLWFSLQVQQLQGVYNLQEPHFWTLCTDVYIGTLKLLVAPDADSRWILSQTHNIFTQVREERDKSRWCIFHLQCCTEMKSEMYYWCVFLSIYLFRFFFFVFDMILVRVDTVFHSVIYKPAVKTKRKYYKTSIQTFYIKSLCTSLYIAQKNMKSPNCWSFLRMTFHKIAYTV